MRLIDGDALYERASELESQALSYVGKIMNDETKVEEWRRWSAILVERTAFKHDAYDAPTVDPVRHGKWLPKHHYISGYEFVSGHICSECGNDALNAEDDDFLTDFCPNCGAKMEGEEHG